MHKRTIRVCFVFFNLKFTHVGWTHIVAGKALGWRSGLCCRCCWMFGSPNCTRDHKAEASHRPSSLARKPKRFPEIYSLALPTCVYQPAQYPGSLQATFHFGIHSKHIESNGKILIDLRGLPDRPSVSATAPNTKLEMLMWVCHTVRLLQNCI